MTARLGSEYRYFGKLVLVPFRYFSIDIYRNIDIFDNTTTHTGSYLEAEHTHCAMNERSVCVCVCFRLLKAAGDG